MLDWTDLQCLQRAREGDALAFRTLVDRHAASLYRVALGLVGNAADAEDVVQESLLGAAISMHRFNNQASVKTWLTRIVVIQSARCHRSRKRRTQSLDALPLLPEFHGVEGRIGATEAKIDVTALLAQLAPEHRQVLVLRELQGMSYEEIASILEIPRGTVESRLHRARQTLKQRFGDSMGEEKLATQKVVSQKIVAPKAAGTAKAAEMKSAETVKPKPIEKPLAEKSVADPSAKQSAGTASETATETANVGAGKGVEP